MTVIPFPINAAPACTGPGPKDGVTRPVTGSYPSPSGRAGTFTGYYRFDRLVSQFGQPAAAGIFAGELVDADGSHLGRGSRRHTAAAQVVTTPSGLVIRVGPVDVNINGFLVTMAEAEVRLGEPDPADLDPSGDG